MSREWLTWKTRFSRRAHTSRVMREDARTARAKVTAAETNRPGRVNSGMMMNMNKEKTIPTKPSMASFASRFWD
jgi:hypothetical protein